MRFVNDDARDLGEEFAVREQTMESIVEEEFGAYCKDAIAARIELLSKINKRKKFAS